LEYDTKVHSVDALERSKNIWKITVIKYLKNNRQKIFEIIGQFSHFNLNSTKPLIIHFFLLLDKSNDQKEFVK